MDEGRGRRRWVGRLRDVVVVLGMTAAMVVALEVGLRLLYGGDDGRERKPSLREINEVAFQSHPEYLVAVKPNLHDRPFVRRTKTGEIVTHWSTNSASFRGPEIGGSPGLRIIVYGDSNVFARFSDDGNTFPARLQERLRSATGHPVEVINAGVPGFGPDQSLLRFQDEVDRYRPDIVVFHVFADNDFGDVVRNRLFQVSPAGRLVRTSRRGEADPCFVGARCGSEPGVVARAQDFASSLYITRALRKLLKMSGLSHDGPDPHAEIQYYLRMNEHEYQAYTSPTAAAFSHFVDHYDYDVALHPGGEAPRTKLRLMREVLHAARELAAAKHVRFLLVIQPSSRDLTENVAPNFTHMARYPDYRRTGLTRAIEDIARSLHLDYVNLFEVFERNHPERLYFDGDDHWNDEGQRIAAEEAARYITARFGTRSAALSAPAAARRPHGPAAPAAAARRR
jgi:hypothetical protein